MNSKPFQFRYVNEIVGVFVLVVVALLVGGVILAGRAQGWFDPVYRLPIDFPQQGTLGLEVGSPVQILGTTVGIVEEIDADENGVMRGVLRIKGDFYQFIRTDSKVLVKKKFGVVGDPIVDITKGTGPELPAGGSLMAVLDTDVLVLVQELVNQVRDAALTLMASITRAAEEYTGLAADIRSPEGPIQQMLADIEAIIGRIEAGEGPAGRLVSDETTAKAIDDLVVQLQAIVTDIRQATAELPDMARTVGGEVGDIPGTVTLTQETIRETERLIEGLQRHWLLRKYIPQSEPTPLIPAYDIPAPRPAGIGSTASTEETPP